VDRIRAAAQLFDGPLRTFAVRLWDGTFLPPRGPTSVAGEVVLRRPGALDAFVPPASEPGLAEAFIDGDLELEGDAIALLEAAARWDGPRLRPELARAVASVAVSRTLALVLGRRDVLRGRMHSVDRDRAAVRRHYDISNDFYRLFLDQDLVYSCAWFRTGTETLEEAQRAKLDLVCRKLALRRGERFLDIGCGWGALVAHAARRYGATALGFTNSGRQLEEGRERLARGGSGATVVAGDYRTFRPDAPFDKVASVGMMEHVGRQRLDAYFAAIHRLVAPGGLFLNHAIADAQAGLRTVPWATRPGGGFIERHIFPDHDLVPLGAVVSAAERAGFEVRDVESLREHYAETLAAWLARLERRFDEARILVGPRLARAWRLYLASSAAAFRLGRITVFQVLLARRTAAGQTHGLPRSRDAWYRDAEPEPAPARRDIGGNGAAHP
jgi:cyclopropane-fatty-acyl-phospholipid synthase